MDVQELISPAIIKNESRAYARGKDYTFIESKEDSLFEPVSTKYSSQKLKLKMLAVPIYYLFDGHINKDFGSTSKHRNIVSQQYDINCFNYC